MKSVLLADDDYDDQLLFKIAFSSIISDLALTVVSSGQQVLNYLEAVSNQLPSLIILDYNMPNLNGADVIRAVYRQSGYSVIPIVVFSSSGSDDTVTECLKEGAVKCFVKPMGMKQLIATTEEILKFCC